MSDLHPAPWTWDNGRPKQYDLTWLCDATGERIFTNYGKAFVETTGKERAWKAALAKLPELIEVLKFHMGELRSRGLVPAAGQKVLDELDALMGLKAPRARQTKGKR